MADDVKRDVALVILFSGLVFIMNIWKGSLSSWDEAYYAYISMEVLKAKSLFYYIWPDTTWTDKPVFYMWFTALFYKMFGINEFAVRLFSALSGVGVAVVTYLFSRRFFSRTVGILAAMMLVSTYHFIWLSKMGHLDVTYTLFLFLAIYFYMKSEEKKISLVYSFFWITLAFLVKGVAAFFFPMIIGLYVLTTGKWETVFNRYTLVGVMVFLLVGGGWFLVRGMMYGEGAISDHFYHHLIKRTMTTLDGHQGNWLTGFNVLLYKGKPWGAIGLMIFPFFVAYSIRARNKNNFILISWALVIMLVFVVCSTKLHWYMIPIYPPILIIAAWGCEKIMKNHAKVVFFVFSLCCLLYFGIKKEIFTLNFNPVIKKLAKRIETTMPGKSDMYIFGLNGDPAMRFYLDPLAKRVKTEEELLEVSKKKGVVILVDPGVAETLKIKGKDMESGHPAITMLETQ